MSGTSIQSKPQGAACGRVDRFVETAPPEDEVDLLFNDQDYCSVSEPTAMDMSASAVESVSNEVQELRKELQELRLQREFGLQRFAGSDADIRIYTREVTFSQSHFLY